jgi:tetratricopeptide (TPR) repeat protein
MSEAQPDWDDLIVETTEIIGAVRAPAGRRSVGGRDGTLSNKAKVERAKTDLTVSTETDPAYAQGFFARGIARLEAGELENAIDDLSGAIWLDPTLAIRAAWNDLQRRAG